MTIKEFKEKFEEMLQNGFTEDSEVGFYVNGNDGAYKCNLDFSEGEFIVCLDEDCKMDFCDNHLSKDDVRNIIENLSKFL